MRNEIRKIPLVMRYIKSQQRILLNKASITLAVITCCNILLVNTGLTRELDSLKNIEDSSQKQEPPITAEASFPYKRLTVDVANYFSA